MSGEERLQNLLRKPVFKGWIERVGEDEAKRQMATRVKVVGGSLESLETLPKDLDVVIHGASTVSFDPPIDEAFDTNVGGAIGLYGALLKSKGDPHVVHVSTCYVGGIRKGIQPEESLQHNVDVLAEYEAAQTARKRVEFESREPEQLREFLQAAKSRHGKAGPQLVAQFAEAARAAWVKNRLVDSGRMRAESLGWTDVYTLTKAFAERIAETRWAEAGHRLSVVRPSIIESALHHPFPGWIDGFKVADPLIIAYGRGQLPEFPGLPDSVLDVIPVDFVVNATLAAAANPPAPKQPKYYHISSGASNPLPFHKMYELVHDYFTENPLPDTSESRHDTISVPTWRFPGGSLVERELRRQESIAFKREQRISKARRSPKARAQARRGQEPSPRPQGAARLHRPLPRLRADRDHLRRPEREGAQRRTAGEGARRSRVRRARHRLGCVLQAHPLPRGHDPHPGVRVAPVGEDARPRSRSPSAPTSIAVFDLEGTVIDSNLVKQYLMLWEGAAQAPLGARHARLRRARSRLHPCGAPRPR